MYSLSDVESIGAVSLRRRFHIEVFNKLEQYTVTPSSRLKSSVQKKCNKTCVVCGRTATADRVLSVSPILKYSDCFKLLDIPHDASNYLLLCGVESQVGTCHYLFDQYKMSFVHISGGIYSGWQIVGGGAYHGKHIILPTNPRKRVLHAHFTKCVLIKSLEMPENSEIDYEIDESESSQEVFTDV